MQAFHSDRTTMQTYLLLSFAAISLAAKQQALPTVKFVYKRISSNYTIHLFKVQALPDTTSCATYYYYSTETNAKKCGFFYGANNCLIYEVRDLASDRDHGFIWQTSSHPRTGSVGKHLF